MPLSTCMIKSKHLYSYMEVYSPVINATASAQLLDIQLTSTLEYWWTNASLKRNSVQNSCTHKTFLQTPAVWMVGKSAATVTWVFCTAPSTENHGRMTKHRQSFWRCLRADWKRNVLQVLQQELSHRQTGTFKSSHQQWRCQNAVVYINAYQTNLSSFVPCNMESDFRRGNVIRPRKPSENFDWCLFINVPHTNWAVTRWRRLQWNN